MNIFSSPGFKLSIVHLSPVNSSFTSIFLTVRLPLFVTEISYSIFSPRAYTFPSFGVLTVRLFTVNLEFLVSIATLSVFSNFLPFSKETLTLFVYTVPFSMSASVTVC